MTFRTLTLALAGLSLAFAPAPLPKPVPPKTSELKKLAGTWAILSRSTGKGRGRPWRNELKVVIVGDRWKFTLGTRITAEYKIEIDPGKKPREMNLTGVGRPINLVGIYSLEGNTLKVCYALARNGSKVARPTAFTGGVNMTLQREKR
jgi:uncharacterized protein (TIGR03067 family)